VFKMGFLSMIAATGLFVAANGFAADAHTTSTGEGVKAKVVSDDVKIPETPAPRWHNAPINLNFENEVAAGTLRQVHETTRSGGTRSDNDIRADEITMPVRAPWRCCHCRCISSHPGGSSMEQDLERIARRLTHDELTAAEDAFQGRPLNEACSWATGSVYVGILVAKNKLHHERSTLGRPVPSRDLRGVEDLVGTAAHGGDGEGFNGV
jgi:hypothetical protein